MPSLRERREDIPLLVDHLVAKYNALRHRTIEGVSAAAMAVLMAHDYPGNVRELENAIEHAFVLCPGSVIEPGHLPPALAGTGQECAACGATRASVQQFEAGVLADALRRHGGNRAAAARELGIDRSTLFRKIRALGIHSPRYRGRPERST